MTKGFDKLTKKEQQELEKLIKEITDEAKQVVDDYTKNPSEISGSIIQIHEDSPLLKEERDSQTISYEDPPTKDRKRWGG